MAALIALPAVADAAWLVRASLIWLTAIGVMGQNLLIGYTGLISFGQAGFLAIGAYTFGHLRIAGVPLPLALAGGGAAAALAGVVVGFPSLRLKGPYLAIATLGFGVATYQVVASSEWISGGRNGLAVPRLARAGGDVPGGVPLLRVPRHPRSCSRWRRTTWSPRTSAGRGSPSATATIAAEAMGVNLTRYKLLAFAVSSFYTGVQGALYGLFLGHLEPQTFNLSESITLFVAVIVGGLASVEGSILGAAFVILVPPCSARPGGWCRSSSASGSSWCWSSSPGAGRAVAQDAPVLPAVAVPVTP